jgi:hypothetical protein
MSSSASLTGTRPTTASPARTSTRSGSATGGEPSKVAAGSGGAACLEVSVVVVDGDPDDVAVVGAADGAGALPLPLLPPPPQAVRRPRVSATNPVASVVFRIALPPSIRDDEGTMRGRTREYLREP